MKLGLLKTAPLNASGPVVRQLSDVPFMHERNDKICTWEEGRKDRRKEEEEHSY